MDVCWAGLCMMGQAAVQMHERIEVKAAVSAAFVWGDLTQSTVTMTFCWGCIRAAMHQRRVTSHRRAVCLMFLAFVRGSACMNN